MLSHFTKLKRANTKLGVAGKILTPQDAEKIMDSGVDWVMLGRAAIIQHNFPELYAADPGFEPVKTPVSRDYLASEGLSTKFINYMSGWKGFVE